MKFNYRYDAKKGKIIKESLLKEDATLFLAAGLGALVGAILGMTASKYVGAFSVEGAKDLANSQKDLKETIKKEIDSSSLSDEDKAVTKKSVEEKFNKSAENISTISKETSDQTERTKKFNQELDSLSTAISTDLEEKRILTDTIKKTLQEELAKQKRVVQTQTVGGDQAEQLKNQIMEEVVTPEATRTATEKLVDIADGGSDSIKKEVVDAVGSLSKELEGEKRKAVEDAVIEYEYTDEDFKNQLITIVQSGSVKPPTPPPADLDQAPEATQTAVPPESPTPPAEPAAAPADEPAGKPQGPTVAETIQKLKDLNQNLTLQVIEQNIDTYISGIEILSNHLTKFENEREDRGGSITKISDILLAINDVLRKENVLNLNEDQGLQVLARRALSLANKILKSLKDIKAAMPDDSNQSKESNAITEDNVPVCEACLYRYMKEHKDILVEAKYHGKSVQLGKPSRGDVKKYKVFVKDPQTGNVKKVNFGDPNMEIKRDNPNRRKNFRARHNCANPGPRTKARYWSCRFWSKKPVSQMVEEDQEIKEAIQRMKQMAGLVED